jgi:hypothetical protein
VNTTGIFGLIRNATIKNLRVTGVIDERNDKISDRPCYSSDPDIYGRRHYYYGGICGLAENSTIGNCDNNVRIGIIPPHHQSGHYIHIGGICGQTANSPYHQLP